MRGAHNFEHLPLILRYHGPARMGLPPLPGPQTLANKTDRQTHSSVLETAVQGLTTSWQTRRAQRQVAEPEAPELPAGVPILLQIDPDIDLDFLRHALKFEIVAEQEEGYVIVASEDIQLSTFRSMLPDFVNAPRCAGS